MTRVYVYVCDYVEAVYDEEEGDDPWRYHGTEVHSNRIVALHRSRREWKDRLRYHDYADVPYTKVGKKYVHFELPEGKDHGFVVYFQYSEWNTFGGQENLLGVMEVFEYEEDAKAFVELLKDHFQGVSSWDFVYGQRSYYLGYDQVTDIDYQKVAVE
jgi:hypothetical protein